MRSDVFPGDVCVFSTRKNGAISQMTPEQIPYILESNPHPAHFLQFQRAKKSDAD